MSPSWISLKCAVFIFTPRLLCRASRCSLFREIFFLRLLLFSESWPSCFVSQTLVVWSWGSNTWWRDEAAARKGERVYQWASDLNMCGVPPSLVEVEEEEELISEEGELMRRGDGEGRGEKGGAGTQICDQCVRPLLGSWRRRKEQEEKHL